MPFQVVNAIGRSRVNPQRAEATIDRIDQLYQLGDKDVRPDVVSYNALLNAYGWSNERGKAKKCFEIYKRMLKLYKSKLNIDAKPDIITCNSILNACAFDTPGTDTERAEIIDIVVQTLEDFQSSAPAFGFPNSLTYSHVLSAIANHMPMSDQRMDMAKATFWQVSAWSALSIPCFHHWLTCCIPVLSQWPSEHNWCDHPSSSPVVGCFFVCHGISPSVSQRRKAQI